MTVADGPQDVAASFVVVPAGAIDAASRAAGRSLARALEQDHGAHLARLKLIEDLFLPKNPQGAFAIWFAANLGRVATLKFRGSRTLGERLREHRESVFLARKLTHITCDMQLGVEDSEGLRRRKPDAPALADLYDRLGFGPFLRHQSERLAQIPT